MPYWIASGGNKYLFWMCLGWLYKLYEEQSICMQRSESFYKRIVYALIAFLGMLYLYRIINVLIGDFPAQKILGVTSIVPIMAVIWITKSIESIENIYTKMLKKIGRNTIYVLCVHSFGVSVVGGIWVKLGIYNVSNPIMMIVRMVFTITFAYVLKRIHIFFNLRFCEKGRKNETR